MSSQTIILAQSDFKIPAPKTQTSGNSNTSPAPAPPPATTTQPQISNATPGISAGFNLGKPVSSTEIAVAGAVFLVLLIPFFFGKMAVTRSLQSRLAAPAAASAAGWMFFAWLAYTAIFLIASYVGNFWSRLLVVGPGGSVSFVLLIIFLTMRSQALKTRR